MFFKQIKQTLQLADFLGHNANAVRWQVWMALLIYVLFATWVTSPGGRIVSRDCSPACARYCGNSSTCSSYWVVMGQQAAVSEIWRGQNKPTFQDSDETMGEQTRQRNVSHPAMEPDHVKNPKSRF